MENVPLTFFYIPKEDFPKSLPPSAEQYWSWIHETEGVYRRGKYNWILQAYLNLQEINFPCQLVDSIPDNGIVITHRAFLPDYLKPMPEVLLVCIQADRPRHPYAQLHVVQNLRDVQQNSVRPIERLISRDIYYIPYWPQPGLIPRDSRREERFENAAYFGIFDRLSPAVELRCPSWQEQLSRLGLNWQIVQPENWNNYREVDVIVAIRSFDYTGNYFWKPASKLINAWHAGVPAILGRESAFQAQRRSELDYIEVTSVAEAIAALKNLRDNPKLRQAMVENGRVRAEETKPTVIAAQWREFLLEVATPVYEHWCSTSSLKQKSFLLSRYVESKLRNKLRFFKHKNVPRDLQSDEFKKSFFWN